VVNTPLSGIANGIDGANGIYVYTGSPAFPANDPGVSANYWVDVVFSATNIPPCNCLTGFRRGTKKIIIAK